MKAVLDIGKTNVKLQLLHESGSLCEGFSRKNKPINSEPYPHADVDGIWAWLIETLRVYPQVKQIRTLIVTTHGATAALINRDADTDDGLVLPVLDYEFSGINECDKSYNSLRPHFAETLSPDLPAGLNLGRQIYWLQQTFPGEFGCATDILMYPQYWAWRLTGQLAGEVTSLGCHTDLWAPTASCYSTLVERCHWKKLMPPLQSAWQELGVLTPLIAEKMSLSPGCKVHVGLHDSNASYLRYLLNFNAAVEPFTVISTGTWTILMHARGNLAGLSLRRDALANCDIYGDPVACARFMGGREYEVICERLGGNLDAPVSSVDVQTAVNNFWMITPDFSDGNGPFGGLDPVLHCPVPAVSAGAIATLYCALMIDQRLDDLQASGPIYIEGAFLKNPLLCHLVAQLRSHQPVYFSADDTGTVQGALLLTTMENQAGTASKVSSSFALALEPCAAANLVGLIEYKTQWYSLIAQRQSHRTSS